MKFVYVIEFRELSRTTNCFELHRTEIYSSKIKAQNSVENIMECNKAFNINEDTTSYLGEKDIRRVNYSSLGWGRDDARVEMRLRLIINKLELR